jgi:hypothetical protein
MTIQQPTRNMRPLPLGIAPETASVLPWLRWARASIRKLEFHQRCFLAEILCERLLSTIRINMPSGSTDLISADGPEKPLFAAFCLASELQIYIPVGSSMILLQQAVALAGVRMHFSNIPTNSNISDTNGANELCSGLGVARFVEWADVDLQEWAASKLRRIHDGHNMDELFNRDSDRHPS